MVPLTYALEDTVLGNGLRVVVNTDRALPFVAVNLWVAVGSRHERPGRTGLAHLFEHLMFQGSASVAEGEHFAALLAEGARLNATTSFDRTNYFEMVPRGALELALWLEADRHGGLLPALTQENFGNQRDVVKEEKRQRYDNVPYGDWLATTVAQVFPRGHQYHHIPIGSMADLDAATLADARDFYRAHYRPANTVLTLAGDIGPDEGFELAQRYFGTLVNPPAELTCPPPPAVPLAPLSAPEEITRVADVPHDRVYLSFRLPEANTPGFFAAALALDIIGGLESSRMERQLVRGSESATAVTALSLGLTGGTSLGMVMAEVADGTCAQQVREQIAAELSALAAAGPTAGEVQAAVAQSERQWLSSLASLPERADHISEFTSLYGDPRGIETITDRIGAITAEQIGQAASDYLLPQQAATLHYRRSQQRPAQEARS